MTISIKENSAIRKIASNDPSLNGIHVYLNSNHELEELSKVLSQNTFLNRLSIFGIRILRQYWIFYKLNFQNRHNNQEKKCL